MNVFELAAQYKQLDALVQSGDTSIEELEAAFLQTEGDLKHKIENIGFAIRNREAAVAGMAQALAGLDARKTATEADIERLKKLALDLMISTDIKKIDGNFLKIGRQSNPPSVKVLDEAKVPQDYKRVVPAQIIQASWVIDKDKIKADAKLGVIIDGVEVVTGQRLTIK